MRRGLPLLAALAAASLSSLGYAQTATSPVVGQDRPDQNPRAAPPGRGAPAPAPPRAAQPARAIAPFTVTAVRVEGSSLPAAAIEAVTHRFVGSSVDGEGVNRIADAVAAAYKGGPVALYTVTVPAQDFAGGVLRLTAVEGRIVEAVIQGNVGDRDMGLVRGYVARLTAETPLTRRTLERYIQLIRDVPELNADIQLVPSATLGEVRLQLTLHPRTARFAIAVNNRGTALLGRTQFEGDAYLYSLFRQGDQTRLTVAVPDHPERFQYYAATHRTPIGTDGMTAQVNVGYLRTRPDFLDLNGHAYSAGFQLSHPLVRSFSDAVFVTLGIDGLNSDNALFGQYLSQDRTRAVRAAVSYGHETPDSFFNVSGSASLGLGGALGARTLNPQGTELDFKKLNAKAIYNTRVARQFVLRLDVAGQLSGDRLPGSEQFALGGDEFGRAYEAALVSGDKAVAGSLELAFRPQTGLPAVLSGSELYGFVDGGEVWYRARYGFPTDRLKVASAGGGVRVALAQKVEIQVEAARGLTNPVFFLDRKDTRVVAAIRTIF
jgi:hemolysin activation/secretion protein